MGQRQRQYKLTVVAQRCKLEPLDLISIMAEMQLVHLEMEALVSGEDP